MQQVAVRPEVEDSTGIGNDDVNGTQLDETALAALDAAAEGHAFDEMLLRAAPAHDIGRQVKTVIKLLENLDLRKVFSKQGWFSRLSGQDVEARLEFEIAARTVMSAIDKLRVASKDGRNARLRLEQSSADISNDQVRFEQAISKGKSLLAANAEADPQILARYERRLANIMTIHVANTMTLQQIRLALDLLSNMLDRLTDVETVVLPLWQRNVLAVLQTPQSAFKGAVTDEFQSSNTQLITVLKQEVFA